MPCARITRTRRGLRIREGRWQSGELIVNAGLRAEYFSAGAAAEHQTLPGDAGGHVSLMPRIGIVYPLSRRDAFSIAYVRTDQTPDRDLLYDARTAISNRQPLGNPALLPATMISYEAAVKRQFDPEWSLQSSFFYRDVARIAGARSTPTPSGLVELRYANEDQASAAGVELSVGFVASERRRIDVRYTFMQAWGYESRPEGDPYGPVIGAGIAPISEQPLSWERRHSIIVSGVWTWWNRLSLGWSNLVGSPLPWRPKPFRTQLAELTLVDRRRLGWTELTNVDLKGSPPYALGLTIGLEVRNLFDDRSERAVSVDGYPNPFINTLYDDYGAYRTETGLAGGAYWTNGGGTPHWVPVNDPRLSNPPRTVRMSIERSW
jgi:outer membrane receptor protein involved in Fe transport